MAEHHAARATDVPACRGSSPATPSVSGAMGVMPRWRAASPKLSSPGAELAPMKTSNRRRPRSARAGRRAVDNDTARMLAHGRSPTRRRSGRRGRLGPASANIRAISPGVDRGFTGRPRAAAQNAVIGDEEVGPVGHDERDPLTGHEARPARPRASGGDVAPTRTRRDPRPARDSTSACRPGRDSGRHPQVADR